MPDQIAAIAAIGEASSSRGIDQRQAPLRAPDPPPGSDARRGGLRAGAPVDVVELSISPDVVRQLPPEMHLKFLVDPRDNRVVIQVIDNQTDEVIRVVPPSKLRDALRQLA